MSYRAGRTECPSRRSNRISNPFRAGFRPALFVVLLAIPFGTILGTGWDIGLAEAAGPNTSDSDNSHDGHDQNAHENNGDHDAHGDHGSGITNWFGWPGEDQPTGPFGFALLNFGLLIVLLVRFAKKPFNQFLDSRHSTIRDNLAEAAKMRQEAQSKLDMIQSKLGNLETEIAQIREDVRADAEAEKAKIIADAETQSAQLIKAADSALDEELRRARRLLEREAVSAAMTAAEKMLRDTINASDRARINEEYFEQITAG